MDDRHRSTNPLAHRVGWRTVEVGGVRHRYIGLRAYARPFRPRTVRAWWRGYRLFMRGWNPCP